MKIYKIEKNKNYVDELKYGHIGLGASKVIFTRKSLEGEVIFQGEEELMLNLPKLSEGDKGLLLAFFHEYQAWANAPKELDLREIFA